MLQPPWEQHFQSSWVQYRSVHNSAQLLLESLTESEVVFLFSFSVVHSSGSLFPFFLHESVKHLMSRQGFNLCSGMFPASLQRHTVAAVGEIHSYHPALQRAATETCSISKSCAARWAFHTCLINTTSSATYKLPLTWPPLWAQAGVKSAVLPSPGQGIPFFSKFIGKQMLIGIWRCLARLLTDNVVALSFVTTEHCFNV